MIRRTTGAGLAGLACAARTQPSGLAEPAFVLKGVRIVMSFSQLSAGRLLLMPLLLLPVLLSGQLYSVQTFPVGHQPGGLAESGYGPAPFYDQYIAVANLGDSTVSILGGLAAGVGTTMQVASPYNVVPCG